MKQGRRDFNDRAWSPAGRDSYTRSLERRIQRIERAPVKIDIPTVRPPKKSPRVVGPTAGGAAPAILLIVNATHAFRRNADESWDTIALFASGGPQNTLQGLWNKGGEAFFPSNNQIGVSEDNGDTWIEHNPAGSFSVSLMDRDPDGRMWAFDEDTFEMHRSDDSGATWTSATGLMNVSAPYSLSCHPTDANRIALGCDNGDASNNITVHVSTNGSSFTERVIIASGGQLNYRPRVIWLPNGRLVALLEDLDNDDLYATYSDDDGVSWSSPDTIVTAAANLRVNDLRVTESGCVFGAVSLESSNVSLAVVRSVDGETWEALTPHVSEDCQALAFHEARGDLYVSYQTDRIFKVPDAETIDAGDFVSGSIELDDVPAGVATGDPEANMVVL